MLKSNHRARLRLHLSFIRLILPFKGSAKGSGKAAEDWTRTSWGQKFIKSATLTLLLFCSAGVALADLKITARRTVAGRSTTSTVYVKGVYRRVDGIGYTTIYQCDRKRMIQINDKTRTYLITSLAGETKPDGSQAAASGAARRGGVLTYTTTSTDTGETKELLGMKARRFRSRTVVEASEGACSTMNMEMETDGWYVEIPGGQDCSSQAASTLPSDSSDCVDEIRYKTVGATNTGYPVMTTTSIKLNMGENGPAIPPSSSTQEVTDISTATLEQSLFEIPAGYREVKSSQELGSPY